MEYEKISGGHARLNQIGSLFLMTPFVMLFLYIILTKELTFDVLVFLISLIVISILIVWRAFLFADVYLSNEKIIVKKLFFSRHRKIKEILKVKKAFLPLVYVIQFSDKTQVLFFRDVIGKLRGIIDKRVKNKTAFETLMAKLDKEQLRPS